MSEEEKQAIDWLKEELDDEKKSYKNCNYSYKGVTGLYGNNEVEIALKLIEKQQKEIEEKEKVIDEMAKKLVDLQIPISQEENIMFLNYVKKFFYKKIEKKQDKF